MEKSKRRSFIIFLLTLILINLAFDAIRLWLWPSGKLWRTIVFLMLCAIALIIALGYENRKSN